MRAAAVALLLLPSLVVPLSSQSFDDPCPSRVVRWTTNHHLVEGYLLEPLVDGQSLKVQQVGMQGTKELDWVTPSLACQMQKSNKGNGTIFGLGLGALLGAGVGYASGDDTDCWIMCFTAGEKATYGAVGFGVIGAVIGAIAARGSVWTPLNSTANARQVGLVVNAHGVGVQLRF